MREFRDQEINIDEVKARIRQAVALREAEGRTSFIKASAELFDLLSADDFSAKCLSADELSLDGELSLSPVEVDRLKLQPEFAGRGDDHYHVNDLLKYHDHEFIWNAYLALLKREPDEEGLRQYLAKLRNSRFNKIDVLASLRFSPEGKRKNVTIDGLRLPALIRKLYRVPALGYLTELTVGLARLPLLIRNQRQIEGYLVGQQERVAAHTNSTNQALADRINDTQHLLAHRLRNLDQKMTQAYAQLNESFSRSMSELGTEQKQIARLQHKQMAALFRRQERLGEERLTERKLPISANGARLDLDELYASFQSRFRGETAEVKENLKIYLPLMRDSGIVSDILDIGCGRGEWLELLREEGLPARGLESNRALVAAARSRNLEIVEADATVYLRGLPEKSLQAITAFHFIEHLGIEELIELLIEARRTLRPDGLVILETPNPKNLVVGACNFYSDPTHRRPLFPESLEFILNHSGFVRTRIQYLHPVEGSPFDNGDAGAQALHAWFFSPRDYAVIAYKPAGN